MEGFLKRLIKMLNDVSECKTNTAVVAEVVKSVPELLTLSRLIPPDVDTNSELVRAVQSVVASANCFSDELNLGNRSDMAETIAKLMVYK